MALNKDGIAHNVWEARHSLDKLDHMGYFYDRTLLWGNLRATHYEATVSTVSQSHDFKMDVIKRRWKETTSCPFYVAMFTAQLLKKGTLSQLQKLHTFCLRKHTKTSLYRTLFLCNKLPGIRWDGDIPVPQWEYTLLKIVGIG
ncbi:hypothetical protein BDQ17DRAFT_1338772 [Cyathus striatus]|nr:hypothetical protein BDQ17DRAFT_1338772 [Cyathus striatus]